MTRLRLVLGLLLIWLAALAWPAAGLTQTGVQQGDNIRAELVAVSQWATPGSTLVVAVRQEIAPDWHTYWRNPGDSGGATQLDWRLPPGLTAGEIVWPLPERQRLQTLMNYGYSGEVYLPVPIEVPADAAPGSTLPLRVEALFMVCSAQMCIPVELTLGLDLPVRAGAAPEDARHGAAIRRVLEAAPRPGGLEATISGGANGLTLSVAGEELAGRTPRDVWFFPFRGGIISHPAEQPGERGPRGVTLNLTPGGAVVASGLTGPVEGVLATELGAWEITAQPGAPLAGTSGEGALQGAAPAFDAAVFFQAALFALIGGLILNLMPCVFPILAMKAAALTAGAHDMGAARRDGLAFTAGVLVTFLMLAGVLIAARAAGGAAGWGFQLQSPGLIAALALLMLAVGLNLSGVFHVGASLQGTGGPLSRLPGGVGAFFTGVLAVVVASPCTAPFMAFALGAALVMPAPLALVVFLFLGLGLALPYLIVSLSPRLLARLPRPGPWMDRLKGLLAFPMYGAGLWLVWVFSRQTGAEALALLLAAALLLALGLWLWGRAQADRAEGGRGRIGLVAGGVALLIALAAVVAAVRLPPAPAGEASGGALASQPWSPEAVTAARAEGRPVFVNFTADWCVTCKVNEGAALAAASTRVAIQATGATYLVGDWTLRDDVIAAELERHGRSGVPLYLVYAPGEETPRILPQLLTPGVVIRALEDAAT